MDKVSLTCDKGPMQNLSPIEQEPDEQESENDQTSI